MWWLSVGLAFLVGFHVGRRRFTDAGRGPRALEDQLREERRRRVDRG